MKSILFIDALLYLFGIIGIYLISIKADLPFQTEYNESTITIKKLIGDSASNLEGQSIASINGYVLSSPEETETYLDGLSIGETVKILLSSNTEIKVQLINYYSFSFLILSWLIGSSFFAIAIIVLIKACAQKPARLFHWVCVFTALIMMMTWGYYNIDPKPLGFIFRGILHLSVSIVPALFLHFTLVFPREKKLSSKFWISSLYIVSMIIFIILQYNILSISQDVTISRIKSYVISYNISRIYLIICIIAAIIVFVHSYKTSPSESDKKKLKWILYGLSIGPLSFILLWTLPIMLTDRALVPEELVIILISVIPITFGISIVKYHIMDVDYLINRSVVYALVIGALLIIYLLIIGLLTNFALPVESRISSIISALSVALLFQPVRDRVQKFVDKKFFRVRYNFREAIKNIFAEIHESNDVQFLANKIVKGIDELVPVEKIGFFILNSFSNRLKLLAHKNFDLLVRRSVKFQPEYLKQTCRIP